MLSNEAFVRESLALNLFFMRIMKEHLIFILAALPVKNQSYIREAELLTKEANRILADTILISNGLISPEVLDSGELVTEFTLQAELETEKYTGIPIDTRLTEAEKKLTGRYSIDVDRKLVEQVRMLNKKAIYIVVSIIEFKEKLLQSVLSCIIFIQLYPSILDHMIKEAELYRGLLIHYNGDNSVNSELMNMAFWNVKMTDHAKEIRGLLDPTEEDLFYTANMFGNAFELLTQRTREAFHEKGMYHYIRSQSKADTKDIIDFKSDITEGLLCCEIKSMILPLFADHVLREANHYLRTLYKK